MPHKETVVTGVEFIWPVLAELIQIKNLSLSPRCSVPKRCLYTSLPKPGQIICIGIFLWKRGGGGE